MSGESGQDSRQRTIGNALTTALLVLAASDWLGLTALLGRDGVHWAIVAVVALLYAGVVRVMIRRWRSLVIVERQDDFFFQIMQTNIYPDSVPFYNWPSWRRATKNAVRMPLYQAFAAFKYKWFLLMFALGGIGAIVTGRNFSEGVLPRLLHASESVANALVIFGVAHFIVTSLASYYASVYIWWQQREQRRMQQPKQPKQQPEEEDMTPKEEDMT